MIRTAFPVGCLSVFLLTGSVYLPNDPGFNDPFDESGFQYQWIEGFKVYSPVGDERDRSNANTTYRFEALRVIEEQLRVAVGVLPQEAVNTLRKSTIVFLDNACNTDPNDPQLGWVLYGSDREEGEQGVVYYRCFRFIAHSAQYTRSLMLHELAHAWHDQMLTDGFNNLTVRSFYLGALNCWRDNPDSKPTDYWKTDINEFFAEMSSAYFFHIDNELPSIRAYMDQGSINLVEAAWSNPESVDELTYPNYCQQRTVPIRRSTANLSTHFQ